MKVRVDSGCLYILFVWCGLAMIVLSICAFCNEEYFTVGMAIGFLIVGILCLLPTIIKLIIEFAPPKNTKSKDKVHISNAAKNQTTNELLTNITAKKKIIKIKTTKYSEYMLGSTYYDDSFGTGKVVGIGMGYLNVEFLETQCTVKSPPKMQHNAQPLTNASGTHYLAICNAYNSLKATGGNFVYNHDGDISISVLINYCKSLKHCPPINSFGSIAVVLPLYFIQNTPIILYKFQTICGQVGELIELYLIAENNKIRLFTVEWSYKFGNLPPFILCEYNDDKHINYGPVNLDDTHNTIKSIILREAMQ